MHCGRLFVAYRKSNPSRLLVHLGLEGAVLATIGAGLAGFSQYDGVIPIAKNLWSLSFVLVMAGTGFLACLVFFVVVDLRMWWAGSPFRQLGINSIFIYVSHELMSATFPWQWLEHFCCFSFPILREKSGKFLRMLPMELLSSSR